MKVKLRDFDQELQQKRQHDPNRHQDEMEECTFHPKISQSGVSTPKSRGIRDLYEWNRTKQTKIDTEMFARLQNQPKYDFKPSISAKSIKLAESKRADVPLHERLILSAKEKEEKLERWRKEEQDKMFKPAKNLKSIEIMSKRVPETLKKVDNGKSKNIDFFKAIPDMKRALSP